MKYFLFLLVTMFCFPVLSNDFSGKWALSGAGCRDSDLSPESHVSKSFDEIQLSGVESIILTIKSNNTASIIAKFDDDSFSDTGVWEPVGNGYRITPDDNTPSFIVKIIDGYLVVTDTNISTSCQSINKTPVVILGKVQ